MSANHTFHSEAKILKIYEKIQVEWHKNLGQMPFDPTIKIKLQTIPPLSPLAPLTSSTAQLGLMQEVYFGWLNCKF